MRNHGLVEKDQLCIGFDADSDEEFFTVVISKFFLGSKDDAFHSAPMSTGVPTSKGPFVASESGVHVAYLAGFDDVINFAISFVVGILKRLNYIFVAVTLTYAFWGYVLTVIVKGISRNFFE